jgi:hypothetical protein
VTHGEALFCTMRHPMGAGGQGPGAGNNISVRGHPAGITASHATPRGEALVRVVVDGLGLQAIDDSIKSP